MNITDSTQFWKNYKKVFGNKSDNFICNLKQNDVLISADKEKEKLLFETFFTGKHLEKHPKDLAQDAAIENSYRNIKLNFANMYDNQENEEEDGLNEEINIQDIKTAISKQKTSDKACDSDGIHPTILNKLGREALNINQTRNFFNQTRNFMFFADFTENRQNSITIKFKNNYLKLWRFNFISMLDGN